LRVVTSEAVGAPDDALALAVAPIAPEPLVPVVSVPVKVTTVMEAATLCDKVAVTVTFASVEGAKARHTSAVPNCPFVRRTSAHVKPPPVTPAVMPADLASLDINTSSSSLAAVVEKAGDVMVVLEVERSVDLTWSMAMAPHAGVVAAKIRNKPRARLIARRTDECSVATGRRQHGLSCVFQWVSEL